MKIVLTAFKLLWKRKIQNITMLLQILISVITLAQSFVFLMNHYDNVRALTEIPKERAVILNVWDDTDPIEIKKRIEKNPLVDGVGSTKTSIISIGANTYSGIFYNSEIIKNYHPELKEGVWINQRISGEYQAVDVVVSAEIGLKVGDEADVEIDGKKCAVRICGILAEPTQYFCPTGSASPKHFSADAVIGNEPVMIFPQAHFEKTSNKNIIKDLRAEQNLMIFFKQNTQETDELEAIRHWNRFGEITPMQSIISNYISKTNKLISGGLITFCVFLLLAMASVLSNQVIQTMHNRYLFTVYYLVGMSWKQIALTEAIRLSVLVLAMMALVSLAGRAGLLMLEFMTPKRIVVFYGITFIYILLMLVLVGIIFLRKLIKEDISVSLKNLQQDQ